MALIYWAGPKLLGENLAVRIILLLVGLAVCYAFGTLWFVYGYSGIGSAMTFSKAAKICVIPFLPFDLLKLVLALILSNRVKKYAKI